MFSCPLSSSFNWATRKSLSRGAKQISARSPNSGADAQLSSSSSVSALPIDAAERDNNKKKNNNNTNSSSLSLQRRQLLVVSTSSWAAAAAAATAAAVSLLLLPEPPAALAFQPPGFKKDLTKKGGRRRTAIPADSYKEGSRGLKYYDFVVGTGPLAAEGDRVVVHYEARWKGVTFMTSRQGMGVTGGNPLGFDVGAKAGAGGTLLGLDLGVRGMRVGGQRRLLVPPELAYGSKGYGEVPGGATLEFEVELLSVKNSPLGYRVKLVEG